MTRTSATEEAPATPGWVDERIEAIFGPLGPAVAPARDAYANCLAGVHGAVDPDQGHDRCRRTLLRAVERIVPDVDALDRALQALEAEISADS
jgi:hypothetical protein